VAGLTCSGRGDMRGRLGAGMRAIVAAGAGAEDLVVVEAHLHPGRRGVAGFAIGRGRPMRAALPSGNAAIVTANTIPRRALEAAVHVTGRTIDAEMAAGKREAGGEMVE